MASLVDISEWVNRDSAAEPLIALQPLSQVAPLPLSLSLSPSLVAAVADESRDGKRWNRYSVHPSTAAARQTSHDNHYDLAYSLAAAAQKEIGRFAISALQTEHGMLM